MRVYWLKDAMRYYSAAHRYSAAVGPAAAGVLAARTTNFSRTRATLAGVLTGLYPGAQHCSGDTHTHALRNMEIFSKFLRICVHVLLSLHYVAWSFLCCGRSLSLEYFLV